MNHDEENQNNPQMKPSIGAEMEARIVAWVAGEASAFEAAELERRVRETPELGIFKRRIEAVHGLVAEAIKPESEPLRLAPERRAKLLATIGADTRAEANGKNKNAPATLPRFVSRRRDWRRWSRWALPIAASLVLGAILAPVLFRRTFHEGTILRNQLLPEGAERAAAVEMSIAPRAGEPPPTVVATAGVVDAAIRTAEDPTTRRRIEEARARREAETKAKSSILGLAANSSGLPLQLEAQAPVAPNLFGGGGRQRGVTLRNGDASGAGLSYYAGPSTGAIVGAGAISGSLTSEKDLIKQGLIDAPVQMAPFNVTADADRGYAASNTLAGSRLNLPIQDLASSITVVTKEQLADFSKSESFDALAGKKEVSPKTFETDDAKRPASPAGQTKPSVEETSTARDSVSTFSLHVSDVSFRLAQAALARGEMPDASRIRPEEFYNAFDYGDAAPTPAEKIGCRIEQSAHPFLQQRNLVRIAMKVPATGRGAGTPLRLTILLDTSGSMEREDRAAAVRAALNSLVSLVGANDRVTLIGFARTPRLIAEDLPGDRARELLDLVARTPAEGGTNLEAALALAGELVDRHFLAAAQNRIVLITDGAANLGAIDPKVLAAGIETLRARHIALDVCGVGLNGLDDDMLESLTRKSDGRYYVLNSPADADAGFAQQLAGAFRPAAENVKVQVRFNPARVASYRLIGFEQHRLREEDFRNDKVDAAELAADEAAVALYQVEPLPQGEGELGEVFVRFRDAASGAMVERSWTMTYEPQARAFDRATPSMQLAGTAGLLAEKLRGDTAQTQFKLADLAPVVNALRNSYANQPRVQELATMFAQLRRLSGE